MRKLSCAIYIICLIATIVSVIGGNDSFEVEQSLSEQSLNGLELLLLAVNIVRLTSVVYNTLYTYDG